MCRCSFVRGIFLHGFFLGWPVSPRGETMKNKQSVRQLLKFRELRVTERAEQLSFPLYIP